jgi:hypothetical protein
VLIADPHNKKGMCALKCVLLQIEKQIITMQAAANLRSRKEMMDESRKRMRDIIDERERTLTHDEAMQLVDQAIAEAVVKTSGLEQ